MGCRNDLATAAIAECHGGNQFDLVALCVVKDRCPVPTLLPPAVRTAVRVFQLGQKIEDAQRRAGLIGTGDFFHILVAPGFERAKA